MPDKGVTDCVDADAAAMLMADAATIIFQRA